MRLPLLVSLAALFCSCSEAGAKEAAGESAVFVVIHADLKPDHAGEGTKLLKDFAETARKEKGVGMFEVLAQIDRPNHVTLVEEWASEAAYTQYTGSQASVDLRTRLQPMLGSPFDERLHREVE